jgi:prolyl 4-hydroxylase
MRRIGPEQSFPRPTLLAAGPQLWIQDGFLEPGQLAALGEFLADEDRALACAWYAKADEAGYAAEFAADQQPLLAALADQLERAVGYRSSTERSLRVRAYNPGEGHKPHCDAYEADGQKLAITCLVYLEDTAAGGETSFPCTSEGPLAVAPKKGRMVAWTSTVEGGRDDPASLHAGEPVLEGSKTVLLGFVYLPLAQHPARLVLGSDSAAATGRWSPAPHPATARQQQPA